MVFRSFCVGEVGPHLDKVDAVIKKMQSQMPKDQFVRQLKAILADMDISELLPKIKARTLVLYFNGDNFFPTMDEANFIHKSVPNSKLTVIENTGHMALIQAPVAISALIRLWCEEN